MTSPSTRPPTQTIAASIGAVEYTWPFTITETTGKDISGDAAQISLGTYAAPGPWVTGVVTRPTPASVVVKLLVSGVAPGTYYVWGRVTDSPEVVPRRGHCVVVT